MSGRSPTRVLIADDDGNIREALRDLLELQAPASRWSPSRPTPSRRWTPPAGSAPTWPSSTSRCPEGVARRPPAASAPTAPTPASSPSPRTATGPVSWRCSGPAPSPTWSRAPWRTSRSADTIERVRRGKSVIFPDVAGSILRELAERLAADEEADSARDKVLGRIRSVLDEGGLRSVYQPIIHLLSGLVAGVEALSRFETGVPLQWFQDAGDVGLREELEASAIEAALAGLRRSPAMPTSP